MPTARNRWRRWQRQRLLASADFGISYGSASGDYLSTLHPGLPVVHGRNTSIGSGTSPASRASDHVEILAVGDLTSGRKGIDVLVDALARARSLACRLTVVGGGSDQAALRRRSAGDPRVTFTGPMAPDSVREAYAAADVFAFPSRSDVFGLALVEAMCSGLAVVTSARPGAVADLCVDEHNSLVVRSFEPDGWAAALTRLVEDRVLRERLGREASRTILRRWTIEHASDAMIAGLRLGALAAEGRGAV
jgi:glycosyltransferase involved in cell wall biosynthesis